MLNHQNFSHVEESLLRSRTILINGPVDFNLAEKINAQLLALEEDDAKKPIILWINSPGGEVYSGFSIYDTAQFIKPKIITVIAGMAMSMGSVIALCAEKEDRYIMPNAKVLIHQPLIGGAIQGPASDIEIHARDILLLKERLYELYALRSGSPREVFIKLMERDCFLSPEEALKLGLVSKIIHTRAELSI